MAGAFIMTDPGRAAAAIASLLDGTFSNSRFEDIAIQLARWSFHEGNVSILLQTKEAVDRLGTKERMEFLSSPSKNTRKNAETAFGVDGRIPEGLLLALAASKTTRHRAAAARLASSEALDGGWAEPFLRDPALTIHSAAWSNPNLPPARLDTGIVNPLRSVRMAFAANPSLGRERRIRLMEDEDPNVRWAAMINGPYDEEVAILASKDPSLGVRSALVRQGWSIPPEAEARLLAGRPSWLRSNSAQRCAAKSAHEKVEILMSIGEDEEKVRKRAGAILAS